MIKKELIEQIKSEADIVQIIGEYLPLKPAGKNYRALCPFHLEKTPSFYVSPEKQIYHCFGCGASGSVITFIMEYEKISFPDAVKKLASKLGIKIETESIPYENRHLYEACEFAAQYYTQCLNKSPTAVNYLKERKIADEIIEQFRLGYAPRSNALYNYAKKENFSIEALVEAGLIVKKNSEYYDWFYNRIVFPIFSPAGRVVGFSARTIEENVDPKYINTAESAIFKKREILYGFFQAKNSLYKTVPILVEGNFDVLTLVQNNFKSAIAPLGTALSSNHALLLRRYSNKIKIAFDGDQAGINAAIRAIETLLSVNIEPTIVMLPQDYDPDRFVKTYGKEKFQELLDKSYDYIDFIRYIMSSKEALTELLRLTALIEDPLFQEESINKISQIFNITKETLLNKIRTNKTPIKKPDNSQSPWKIQSILRLERQILSLALSDPQYLQIIKNELPEVLVNNENIKEILQVLYNNLANGILAYNIIDQINNPELKNLFAELVIENQPKLSLDEFKLKFYEYKIYKLQEQISKAEANRNNQLAITLAKELFETKKKVNEIRSKNYDK
ncbi:MAG: DNA primase [candidate division WOR-3 bacterium]|nr:DNA primase [candidate division WOR-3 bacterium]